LFCTFYCLFRIDNDLRRLTGCGNVPLFGTGAAIWFVDRGDVMVGMQVI